MRACGRQTRHAERLTCPQKLAETSLVHCTNPRNKKANKGKQEGLAVASIARDDPSTLPGDDPFPRARMHRDRAR